MTSFTVPAGAGEDAVIDDARLPLAAAAYLARFKGLSREHTDSDLRAFLVWCAGRDIEPLRAQRAQLELYVRWMCKQVRLRPGCVGKGTKVVLVPLPPAVGRAVDRAVDGRSSGPILLNTRGGRMDRHAATRRLRRLAATAGVRLPRMHPHMLRHTFVTTMLDAGVDLRDQQIAARHADPRTRCDTTVPARTSIATPTTSSPRIWPQEPDGPTGTHPSPQNAVVPTSGCVSFRSSGSGALASSV